MFRSLEIWRAVPCIIPLERNPAVFCRNVRDFTLLGLHDLASGGIDFRVGNERREVQPFQYGPRHDGLAGRAGMNRVAAADANLRVRRAGLVN